MENNKHRYPIMFILGVILICRHLWPFGVNMICGFRGLQNYLYLENAITTFNIDMGDEWEDL